MCDRVQNDAAISHRHGEGSPQFVSLRLQAGVVIAMDKTSCGASRAGASHAQGRSRPSRLSHCG